MMDLDLLYAILLLAVTLGVLIALAGMGFFSRGGAPQPEPDGGSEPGSETTLSQARPGGGPCHVWYLPGAGRLARLRHERFRKVVKAALRDLGEFPSVVYGPELDQAGYDALRARHWGENEAAFLAMPADAFVLMIDRPLDRFDARHDRFVIVPLGFMEGAGGVEPFMGALLYDIAANHRDPMDAAETLLRDAAEVALASGFAPPDVLRVLVETFRRQVFGGRYRPFVPPPGPARPAATPVGAHPAPAHPPADSDEG